VNLKTANSFLSEMYNNTLSTLVLLKATLLQPRQREDAGYQRPNCTTRQTVVAVSIHTSPVILAVVVVFYKINKTFHVFEKTVKYQNLN